MEMLEQTSNSRLLDPRSHSNTLVQNHDTKKTTNYEIAVTKYRSEETLTRMRSSPTLTFSPSDLCFEAGWMVHQQASPVTDRQVQNAQLCITTWGTTHNRIHTHRWNLPADPHRKPACPSVSARWSNSTSTAAQRGGGPLGGVRGHAVQNNGTVNWGRGGTEHQGPQT